MSRSDHHFKMGSDPQYAQDYAKLEAYSDWVDKGDRNPFGDSRREHSPEERAKHNAYNGYVSNMTDLRVGEVTEYNLENMQDDPEAKSVHDGALSHAASEWKDYLDY